MLHATQDMCAPNMMQLCYRIVRVAARDMAAGRSIGGGRGENERKIKHQGYRYALVKSSLLRNEDAVEDEEKTPTKKNRRRGKRGRAC
jgi:hypothetical protein